VARTSRKLKRQFLAIVILLAVVAFTATKSSFAPSTNSPSSGNAPTGSLSLVTEPATGITPVLQLIDDAKKSVDLVMYELEDSQVEQALVAAQNRGVHVRVLLNGGYYGKPDKTNPNQKAYDYLQTNHVPVHWTPSYFALTHQKTLVADGKTSIIMTFNLTPKYYATGRDFGIIDNDAKDVAAIADTFNDDWQDRKVTAPSGDDLLWSPGSEPMTLSLINHAKSSLKVYNEEMADTKVASALGEAAMRGVKVEVVMTDQKSWHTNFSKLKSDGVLIRTFRQSAPLYIHAKMIIADGTQAFVGSENFSVTSLDRNRELGIILTDKHVISPLNTTFMGDYDSATPY
jgi:phosphatidylserine/phosphatidylglycerophosphate/cardiolipin synthase-like enzyme